MPSGGKRVGAGRPAKAVRIVRKIMSEEILASVDERALWGRLLSSEDDRIRLDTLKYLTDRRDGKAPQSVAVTGHQGSPLLPVAYVNAINTALGYNPDAIPKAEPHKVIEPNEFLPE